MSAHDIRLLDRPRTFPIGSARARVAAAQARRAARSTKIASLTIAAVVLVVAAGVSVLAVSGQPWNPSFTLASIGLGFLLLGLGGAPLLRGMAVSRMQRSRPEALVFLALRELTAAPHLETYQYRKDNTENIPDSWVMSVVDDRGISVWSTGVRPKELILIQWSEIGEVSAVSFSSLGGRQRIGAALDVRPIPQPLLVSFGFAALGVEGTVDQDGAVAVVDAINSMRAT
ncbi:hypothetical protein IWX81_002204 [Salinibacterium sp. CAN_S4]|uniref:hypothetical protein n=1 Tax=Salinibacterium sp. CAN_S4 TaxID=2787727 RepID=UPI0018EF5E54